MWKFLAYEDASQGKRVRFCIDAETEYKRESAAYVDCLASAGQYLVTHALNCGWILAGVCNLRL